MPRNSNAGESAAVSRYSGLSGAGTGRAVSYASADGALLKDAIEAVTSVGDAIVFALTSDGGALSVRVLSGGMVTKWYPADANELDALLTGLIELK